jgi:hypothetical protein
MSTYSAVRIPDRNESLLTLLRITRHREASVPKDRVFALLGIADEADEAKHLINALRLGYSMSTTETFLTTTRFLIKHHQSLEVLKMVEYLPSFSIGRLSWVPRWNVKEFSRSRILSDMKDETSYRATNDILVQVEESEDATELSVHGQRLGRVTYVSKIMSRYRLKYGEQAESMQIFDLWTDFQKNVQSRYGMASYPTGEDLRRVFCMTIIAGLDEHGKPAGEEFWKHFLYQYAVEMEDNTGGHNIEQRGYWHAGFQDLQLHLLIDQIKGGTRAAFLAAFQRASEHRKLFLTANGYLGLGPAAMEVGDQVCVLFGANVPYVYRSPGSERLLSEGFIGPFSHEVARDNMLGLGKVADVGLSPHADYYLPPRGENGWDGSLLKVTEAKFLIGHCYVHGMMHGEALRRFEAGECPSVIFTFQ